MPDLSLARRVLETEAAAVLALVDRLDERFARAVVLVRDCKGRVIVTGMEEARQEREDEERRIRLADTGTPSPADDDANLRKPVDTFQQSLTALQRRLR